MLPFHIWGKSKTLFEYHHSTPQMRGSQIVFALALILKVRSDAKHEKWCIFEVTFICQCWGIVKNVIKVHWHSRRALNYSVSAARGWLITRRERREDGDMKRAVQQGNQWEMGLCRKLLITGRAFFGVGKVCWRSDVWTLGLCWHWVCFSAMRPALQSTVVWRTGSCPIGSSSLWCPCSSALSSTLSLVSNYSLNTKT